MNLSIGQTVFVFLCNEDLEFYGEDAPNSYEGIFVGMRGNQMLIENSEGEVNCYEPESIFEIDEEDQNIYVIHEYDGGVQHHILNTNKVIEQRHLPYQVVKMCDIDFDEDSVTIHILRGEDSCHHHV